MSTRVTVYTRPGCHLCEEALAVVAKVCADLGEEYDEVNIDGDADLTQRFGEEIPVTFVDGQPARLLAGLGGSPPRRPARVTRSCGRGQSEIASDSICRIRPQSVTSSSFATAGSFSTSPVKDA